jgi:regulator of sigma E protease
MILTIIYFLIALTTLVLIHESGHFVAAKLAGVRVLRFSFGFGKILAAKKWHGTQFAVSLIPLGGYVKMAGEDTENIRGEPDEFFSKPPWVRMLIAMAGPVSNVALAVILYAVVMKAGYTVYTFPATIGGIIATAEIDGEEIIMPAAAAGLRTGDLVKSIGGVPVTNWSDIEKTIYVNPGRELTVAVERKGKEVELEVTPVMDPESGTGRIGILPYQSNDIYEVIPDSAAEKAGVRKGDRLVSFNGERTESYTALLKQLDDLEPGGYEIVVSSAGGELGYSIDYKGGGAEEFIPEMGLICGLIEVPVSVGWGAMFPAGAVHTYEAFAITVKGLSLVITGRVRADKALGGPITIAAMAGETGRAGWKTFLQFIAYLSVILGIMNLLPVPVLDGGHLVFGGVELVSGRRLPMKVREVINLIGLAMIVGIMVLAIFADMSRFMF